MAFTSLSVACRSRAVIIPRGIAGTQTSMGVLLPKYMRNLNTQAEKALIFVIILSRIVAGVERVYNQIAPVRLPQNSCSAVTN